jgi:hypothetical protein
MGDAMRTFAHLRTMHVALLAAVPAFAKSSAPVVRCVVRRGPIAWSEVVSSEQLAAVVLRPSIEVPIKVTLPRG